MFKSVYCKLVESTLTGKLFHWATTRSAKTRFLTPLQWVVAYSIQRIFVAPSWVARPCVRAYGRSHFPTGFVSTSSFFSKVLSFVFKAFYWFIDYAVSLLLSLYTYFLRIVVRFCCLCSICVKRTLMSTRKSSVPWETHSTNVSW